MGWFEDAFSKGGNGQDLGQFNYDTEQDKIKRKRAVAAQLQAQSMQSPKGEFFRSGDFTGYAGGATKGSVLAQLATAALAAYANKSADSDQSALNQQSLDALQYNMNNKPWEQRLADAQAKADADAAQAIAASKAEKGGWQDNPETQSYPVPAPAPADVRPLTGPVSSLGLNRPGFRGGSNSGEWSHEEVPEVFA